MFDVISAKTFVQGSYSYFLHHIRDSSVIFLNFVVNKTRAFAHSHWPLAISSPSERAESVFASCQPNDVSPAKSIARHWLIVSSNAGQKIVENFRYFCLQISHCINEISILYKYVYSPHIYSSFSSLKKKRWLLLEKYY